MTPERALRAGLGVMFLYSGYDIFMHPLSWTWAVPAWFGKMVGAVMPVEAYLRIQGASELAMGALFLVPLKWPWALRIISFVALLEMAAILLFSGVDAITFRDIGLVGAAAALLLISCGVPAPAANSNTEVRNTNQ